MYRNFLWALLFFSVFFITSPAAAEAVIGLNGRTNACKEQIFKDGNINDQDARGFHAGRQIPVLNVPLKTTIWAACREAVLSGIQFPTTTVATIPTKKLAPVAQPAAPKPQVKAMTSVVTPPAPKPQPAPQTAPVITNSAPAATPPIKRIYNPNAAPGENAEMLRIHEADAAADAEREVKRKADAVKAEAAKKAAAAKAETQRKLDEQFLLGFLSGFGAAVAVGAACFLLLLLFRRFFRRTIDGFSIGVTHQQPKDAFMMKAPEPVPAIAIEDEVAAAEAAEHEAFDEPFVEEPMPAPSASVLEEHEPEAQEQPQKKTPDEILAMAREGRASVIEQAHQADESLEHTADDLPVPSSSPQERNLEPLH